MNAARRVVGPERLFSAFVVAVLLATLLASVSHRYFEQRFLRLKDKLAGKKPEAFRATGPILSVPPPAT